MGSLKRKLRRRRDNVNFLEHVRKGTFSSQMIADQIARYTKRKDIDGRSFPRFGTKDGGVSKTGYCTKCGKRSYPFKTCRDCRETEQIRRYFKELEATGQIEEVGRDGRFKTYRKTNKFIL